MQWAKGHASRVAGACGFPALVPKEQAQLADDPAVTANALVRLDSYVAFKADPDSPTCVPGRSRCSAAGELLRDPRAQAPLCVVLCRMLIVSALAVVGTYVPAPAAPAVEAKAAVAAAVKTEGDKENTAQPAAAHVAAAAAAAAPVEPAPAAAPANLTASPQYGSVDGQALGGATWTCTHADPPSHYRRLLLH